MNATSKWASLVPGIPYLAVLIGLYGLSSAWWAMGLYHTGALACVFLNESGPTWRVLHRGWNWRHFLVLAVPCAASGPLLLLLYPLAVHPTLDLTAQLAGLGVSKELWLVFSIYYCSVTPWLEELFWRGHLGSGSMQPDRSDLFFAVYHLLVLAKFLSWPWLAVVFFLLTGMAWLWRRIYLHCGGLVIPVITHLMADVSVMVGVYMLMKNQG